MLNKIAQYSMKERLGFPPSLSEVCDNISAMGNNKPVNLDGIPSKIPKVEGINLHQHIHGHIVKIWYKEVIPFDLRDALQKGRKGHFTPVHHREDPFILILNKYFKDTAKQRTTWRNNLHKVAMLYKENLQLAGKIKRQQRKDK